MCPWCLGLNNTTITSEPPAWNAPMLTMRPEPEILYEIPEFRE